MSWGEMSFVLHPSNPQHSIITINNSSPVILHHKYVTAQVNTLQVREARLQMPQESQIRDFYKIHAHLQQFEPTAHS